jgi:hypothetical protein
VAILQERTVPVSELAGFPAKGMAEVQILTRLREIRFPLAEPPRMELVFEPFAAGVSGKKLDDVVLTFGMEIRPPNPPEDITDPETGEVLVAAGAIMPALPSLEQVKAVPLPEGAVAVETFGQLIDAARRQIYLAMIGLMPQWQDGTEG